MNTNNTYLAKNLLTSISYATAALLILAVSFTLVEPQVMRAQTNTFKITQSVTAEISFLATSSAVTMVGPLTGITGGNATGTTFVVVQTNSAGGYNMTLAFSNTPAMRGDATGNTGIVNYGTTTEPTFNFVASSSAVFAYTVNASTTADLDQSFRNNGSVCNAGAAWTANTCWMGASTTGFQIINRLVAATTSATTTLQFRVNIPNNPSPALQSDTYTATATLTAVAQ